MDKYKRIFSYSFIAMLSSIFPFFLLPFLTHQLTMEEYGIYSYWYVIITVLSSFVLCGSISSYTTYFSRGKSNTSGVVYYNLKFSILLTILILFFLVLYNLFYNIGILTIIIPIFILSRSQYLFYQHFCRVNRNIVNFTIISIPLYALVFGIPIILIKFGFIEKIATDVLYTMAIVMGGFTFILLYLDKAFVPDKKQYNNIYTEIKKFGFYSGMHVITAALVTVSDRIILKHFLDSKLFAIYALSATLTSILSLVMSKVSQSMQSELYLDLDNVRHDARREVAKNWFYKYFLFISIVTLIFVFSLEFVVEMLFPPSYLESINYARLLSIAIFFQGLYYFSSTLAFYLRMSREMFFISIIVGVIGVVLNTTLAINHGIDGVIISLAITWLFYFIITTWVSVKKL
ncbi:lipopolysaccharide biosynthesis protein [Vibrio sp. TRT 21S02]|uniref:lipopolysaccharide biosynthesis protein n=1 Tax=Vibrio sp. TRT 21S02 TaxID=3418507 RepID=UPI003CE7F736